jgi:transposase
MVECDVHDETLVLKMAVDRLEPELRTVENTASGRAQWVRELGERSRRAWGAKVVLVYEASSQGFGLHDELVEAGFGCHVLAPTKIARSSRDRRQKNDGHDAQGLLELLRGHVLGGNELPAV